MPQSILFRDNDEMMARRTADQICHLLRDFIPKHSYRDAWNLVAETCLKEGLEMTNKMMRKEYEAWKSTELDMGKFDLTADANKGHS